MTESEWLTSKDPAAMLAGVPGKVSDRKVRLFACAWARSECGWWVGSNRHRNPGPVDQAVGLVSKRITAPVGLVFQGAGYVVNQLHCQPPNSWSAAADEVMAAARRALEVAERFADGAATDEERAAAYKPAMDGADGWMSYDLGVCVDATIAAVAATPAGAIPGIILSLDPYLASPPGRRHLAWARARQVELLREILGNPFRPVVVKETWLHADGGAVSKLAQEVYDHHRIGDLRRLEGVLRRVGCADPDLLGHCHSRGPHFRGCWALDALLGRK
jgi:hypothetical protein